VKSFRTIYNVSSERVFVGDIGGASARVRDPGPPNGDAGDRLPKSPPLSVGVGIENGAKAIIGAAAALAGNTGIWNGGAHGFFSEPGSRTGVAAADEATGRSFG
jgi:hypothetical protein